MRIKNFKPMLAPSKPALNFDKLRYPLLASPKLDGRRAMYLGGRLLSRNLKPIPNPFVRETLEGLLPDGADMELTVGSTFSESGELARLDGEPEFTCWLFDLVGPDFAEPFEQRFANLRQWFNELKARPPFIRVVPHVRINCRESLEGYERWALEQGYEGVMLRDPVGPYKLGRCTPKQGWLLKVKRFDDYEARVIDLVEQEQNTNEAKRDEVGRLKRSSAKAGKVGKNTLGALRVVGLNGPFKGVEFCVGSGLDDGLRRRIWKGCGIMAIGQTIKYKCQRCGAKDAPRHPVFLGFRDEGDL
jgi:DNA ligase-1